MNAQENLAKRDNQILVSIVEHIDNAIHDASAFNSYGELASDRVMQNSVAMEFIQIAEQAKNISTSFIKHHPQIPWVEIRGLRNRLVHEYDEIEWDIVFDTVRNDLPQFRNAIASLITDEDASDGGSERKSADSIFAESARLD